MKQLIAVSQRVEKTERYGERRDCLDQRWTAFLKRCDCLPILLPNDVTAAEEIVFKLKPQGLLLTGGNSMVLSGGEAPERDRMECHLIQIFLNFELPVLGVCRGMQVIQHFFGQELEAVEGHVTEKQLVFFNNNTERQLNSYHTLGIKKMSPPLKSWAHSADGTIKAIYHSQINSLLGIMWHPERTDPFSIEDVKLFSDFFKNRKPSE